MFLLLKVSTLETNKLRNIYTMGRGARNISINKWDIYYFKIKIILFIIISKKKGKDQESIQSSTTPDPGYQWEVTTSQLDITNESQELSTFPAGDQKASINRRARKHNKNKTEITKIHLKLNYAI